VSEGAHFVSAAGIGAHEFPDGSLSLVQEVGEGQPKHAMHLSAAEVDALQGFLRLVDGARRPPSILDQAREIVAGDREHTHGQPDHNLRAIAAIWSALLRDKLQPDTAISPQLVCLMMAGLKLARASNRPGHREHALDVVGYMALMERCGYVEPE